MADSTDGKETGFDFYTGRGTESLSVHYSEATGETIITAGELLSYAEVTRRLAKLRASAAQSPKP